MTGEPECARGESPATTASEQQLEQASLPATTTAAVTAEICGGENAALPSLSILPSGASGGGADAEAIRREKR